MLANPAGGGPEAHRLGEVGDRAYEFKDTNGFVITFDITSKDVKKGATEPAGGMGGDKPEKGGGGY